MLRGRRLNIKVVSCQQQSISVDCGPFSIANLFMVMNEMDPALILLSEEHLRPHIINCIEARIFTIFPSAAINQSIRRCKQKLRKKTC